MRKYFLILGLTMIFVLSVTTAFAAPSGNKGQEMNRQGQQGSAKENKELKQEKKELNLVKKETHLEKKESQTGKKCPLTETQIKNIQMRKMTREQRQLNKEQKKEMQQRAVEDRLFVRGSTMKFDVPPVVKEDRTLIPVRAITEGLGAEVKWDPETRTVTITHDGTTIELILGSTTVKVNGETVDLDVPAQMISNRTFVPLRFISQTLGEKVEYDPETGDIDVGLEEDATTEITPVEP